MTNELKITQPTKEEARQPADNQIRRRLSGQNRAGHKPTATTTLMDPPQEPVLPGSKQRQPAPASSGRRDGNT